MGNQNNYPYRKFLLGSIPREQSNNNSIITVKYNPNKPNMTLMPSKFQSSDGTASFSQGRNIFLNIENTNIPTNNFALKQAFLNDKSKNCKCETNCENSVCQCTDCNIRNKNNSCTVGKFIPVQSGDQHIQRLKNRAIGRGTLAKKQGDNQVASFTGSNDKKSINYQNTQQALRRLRNRGYVVPPKVVANRNAVGTCLNLGNNTIYIIAYRDDGSEFGEYESRTTSDTKIIDNIFKSTSDNQYLQCSYNKLKFPEYEDFYYAVLSKGNYDKFKNGQLKKADLPKLDYQELSDYCNSLSPDDKANIDISNNFIDINIFNCNNHMLSTAPDIYNTCTIKTNVKDIIFE